MIEIAVKMLVGDRAKFLMLVSALTFASLLMTQQSGVFCGLMRWTTATIRNVNVPIWVVDPTVKQANEVKPLRDTDLARVRSVEGVSWAMPLFQSIQQARFADGSFKTVSLFGLDASTLIGSPPEMLEGKLEDLWQSHAVIVDRFGLEKINVDREKKIGMGDVFEINDREAKIVGICEAEPSFFGYPYVYTTYDRALEIVPKTRRNLGFILVQPQDGVEIDTLARRIEKVTSLKAYTEDEFYWETIWWYVKNTGIPISFGTTIVLGFIVGIAVSGQTFYMFILENMRYLGALKAMGAGNSLLCKMLIVQALLVGFMGFGIGLGFTSLFGFMALKVGQPPFYLPYQVLVLSFMGILINCVLAALIGIRRISRLEAAEVFRG